MKLSKKEIAKIIKVVAYYADPNNYVAIGFFPDPPCGDFINDFSKTPIGYRPGKKARQCLKRLETLYLGVGENRENVMGRWRDNPQEQEEERDGKGSNS